MNIIINFDIVFCIPHGNSSSKVSLCLCRQFKITLDMILLIRKTMPNNF